jgi:hypothetical protein
MRLLFAGPSLCGAEPDLSGIALHPPAKQGDLYAAVLGGASVIGLVDGTFGQTASVWHKEILFALSHGVRVLGAASMGALRAAECAAFGMEPIGQVAHAYLAGSLIDDDAVALLHAPAELGFAPLTEPLVDALASLTAMLDAGAMSSAEHETAATRARRLHFSERDVGALFGAFAADRRGALEGLYVRHRVSLKQQDALALLDALRSARAARLAPPQHWSFVETPLWRQTYGRDAAA